MTKPEDWMEEALKKNAREFEDSNLTERISHNEVSIISLQQKVRLLESRIDRLQKIKEEIV